MSLHFGISALCLQAPDKTCELASWWIPSQNVPPWDQLAKRADEIYGGTSDERWERFSAKVAQERALRLANASAAPKHTVAIDELPVSPSEQSVKARRLISPSTQMPASIRLLVLRKRKGVRR